MSKVVCEICGTKYLDTASNCPICGWKRSTAAEAAAGSDDFDLGFLDAELKNDELVQPEPEETLSMDVQEEKPAAPSKKKEAFDFDAVNSGRAPAPKRKRAPAPAPAPVEEPEEDEEEEEEEEESRSNPFLVIILVILIVALLATSGFIFWKYYLGGNQTKEETIPTTVETVMETEETEAPTVPCTGLSLVSGIDDLTAEGQFWLLHVKASPEDTTDVITYTSADPSIVTVNEEGRVTAVKEGSTEIVITCGNQTIKAPVTVSFQEIIEAETEPVETAAEAETETAETEAVEEETEGEAPEETKREVNPDAVLKLKRTDMTFGIRGVYATLELEGELTPEDVKFTSRNTNVATVNAKGEVTAAGPGLTVITVTYGDQSVECIIRCNF